jgi:surface protein
MFEGASIFNRPLGHFNTAKVTSMDRVFYGAKKFQGTGLATWNTGRVTTLYWAFRNSSMNADISSWNVGSVTDLRDAFRFTPYSRSLCRWGDTLRKAGLPSSRLVNMFASTRCPVQTSPSFASSPTGPLCHACPTWRWGTTCFADGGELYNAAGVSRAWQQRVCRFGDGRSRLFYQDYVYVVSTLPTLNQRVWHPLSVKYGYPIARWYVYDHTL